MVSQESYPERLIDNEMKKVKFDHYHFNGKHNSKKGIPLVVTYHPLLKSVSKIISNKNTWTGPANCKKTTRHLILG